jgi:hypothetical protein
MRFLSSVAVLCGTLLTLSPSYSATSPKNAAASVQKPEARQSELVLAQEGNSRYVIALADDAIPAEKTAARELSDYLQQVTGARVAIKPETQVSSSAPQILVGAGKRVKKLMPGFRWAELGQDGIVIKTHGNSLILARGRSRGALYATYQFLEETVGIRWWAIDATTVPRKRTLRIRPLNTIYTPKLRTREAYYNSVISDPLFATRLKVNGNSQSQGPELGGHNSILGWCHTIEQLLPIEKYYAEHPEWFSDPLNGGKPCTTSSPRPGRWQLCLTNEAARRELTQNALTWIRANPQAGMISISQNDNQERCMADADLAIEKEEGSPSGPLLRFVNAVAADIEKEYPDFLVETLAYQYTQKPPHLVRPRRNVVIRLCSIDADFSRPLDSDANKDFRNDVRVWKAIAPRLYIWDYVANFSNFIFPHPNMRVAAQNIRFFAANNAIGLFEQGDAYTNGTGDFVALRAWVLAHLMWNPQRDQKQLENEFLRGYYGSAAPHLRAYIDGIQQAFARNGAKLELGPIDYPYLTLDVMNTATRQWRMAEAAVAHNPELARRLRRDRLAFDHAWILRYRILAAEARKNGAPFEGPKDLAIFATDFVNTARRFKTRQYAEGAPFENYAAVLLTRVGPQAPLPALLKGHAETGAIDIQESSFRLQPPHGTLIDDPKASDGRAARMPGNSDVWVTQYLIGQYLITESSQFLKKATWHCYASIRVQPKAGAKSGPAVAYGIYDNNKRAFITSGSKTLEEIGDNEYHLIDLGKHEVGPGTYFYAAPPNREDIEAVFIDRVIFVREP